MSAEPTAASSLPRNPRWYEPTPAKYLAFVFAVQAFLIASAYGQWFAFTREKGYAVVITIAVTALMLLLMAPWLLVGRLLKVKAQFSLGTLMLMVPVMAVPCAWFAREYQQAQEQQAFVAEAVAQGYEVHYDKIVADDLFPFLSSSGITELLVSVLGEDFFAGPRFVAHSGEVDDDRLAIIGRLARLKGLFLLRAKVTDAGLAHLAGLDHLEFLTLHNVFDDKPESAICITDEGLVNLENCHALQLLELSKTSISDAGLEHLIECKQLKYIAFETSRITDDGVAKMAGRYQLTALELPNSLVGDAGLESLSGQKKLGKLDVAGTNVGDAGLESLKGLVQLDHLDLSKTLVTNAGLAHLRRHTNLQSLDLSGTDITDKGLAELAALGKLKHLSLRETAVSDRGLAHLKDCTDLTYLHLGRTRVTAFGMPKLGALQKLEHLDLSSTHVTDVALEPLEALPKLAELLVYGSKITRAGASRIEKACPKCRVLGAGL